MKVRRLREAEPRIETGVIQFGQDWPGVFVRGDDAFGVRVSLERVLQYISNPEDEDKKLAICVYDIHKLIKLLELLKNSQVDLLDVKLRGEKEKI